MTRRTSFFVILLTSNPHLRTEAQTGALTCPQGTQQVEPECPLARVFFHSPCDNDEVESQLAAGAWGTDTQGWGRSALSPERAASSTLEHSCGADSEFPPHVVEGRGRGQLFPFTERPQCPRPHSHGFYTHHPLMRTEIQGGRSYYSHFSDEETEARAGGCNLFSGIKLLRGEAEIGIKLLFFPESTPSDMYITSQMLP